MVTDKSAWLATVALEDEVLFPAFGSAVSEETDAVFVIVEPLVTLGRTPVVRLSVEIAPFPSTGQLQEMLPFVPGGGVVQLAIGPAVVVSDVNVIPAGNVSVSPTFVALSGPLFVTPIV